MALPKKPLATLLVGGVGAISIHGAGGFRSSVADISSVSPATELLELETQITDVTDFLKIGKETIQLPDLVKEYTLTLGGAKNFAKILSGSLLLDLIDHPDPGKTSEIQKNLKAKVDALRINSLPKGTEEEQTKIYTLYGGEDKYKYYQALKGIRKIAIDELVKYLPTVLNSATDNLQGTNSGDDLLAGGMGKFYDAVLDDYISLNKPLFVRKWTFSYDSGDIETKIKDILVKDKQTKVPEDFAYPKNASYFFPYISDETKTKFDSFKNDVSSDTHDSKHIFTLSEVENPNNSSQFIISLLKLHAPDSTKNATEVKTAVKLINDNTAGTSTEVSEIVETKDGVFYRDKTAVYFICKDSSKTTTKKDLIEAAKKTGDYKLDLQKELKLWLEKHFERIFLSKWNEMKYKTTGSQRSVRAARSVRVTRDAGSTTQQDTGWDKIADELVKILQSVSLRDSLLNLRKNVLKDYLEMIEKYKPIRIGDEIQNHPILKFAGKFPYEANKESNKETFKYNKLVFQELETAFLKTENSGLKLNSVYETDLYFPDFSTELNSKTKDKLKTNNSNEDNHSLFIFQTTPLTTDPKVKATDLNNLFNNLWISMIYDGTAKDYILQKQLKNYYTKDNKEFEFPTVDKSLFQDGNDQDWNKALQRRYYISKATSALKNTADPSALTKNILENLKKEKEIDAFKQIATVLNTYHSDVGHDLMSAYRKDELAEKITIEFLSKNNLDNYRKFLKHKLSKTSSSAFLFIKRYSKGDACIPDTSKIDEALDIDENKVWEFNNEFLGYKPSTQQGGQQQPASGIKWKPENCLSREDIFDFAAFKGNKEGDTTKVKAGFKGLVFADKYSEILPPDISAKLKTLPLWGSAKNLVDHISSIKTEKALEALITSLKNSFPEISWSFVEEKRWLNPNADYRSQNKYGSVLTLEERKNILIGFINQNSETHVTADSAISYKYQMQNQWTQNPGQSTNSFLNTKLTRKVGFFEHEHKKILEDKEGNKYLVFIIQVKYDDLATTDSWKQLLKTLSPDILASEVVRAAQDKNLQQQVIYHLLNESKSIDKITVGDSRLKEKLGITWIDTSDS